MWWWLKFVDDIFGTSSDAQSPSSPAMSRTTRANPALSGGSTLSPYFAPRTSGETSSVSGAKGTPQPSEIKQRKFYKLLAQENMTNELCQDLLGMCAGLSAVSVLVQPQNTVDMGAFNKQIKKAMDDVDWRAVALILKQLVITKERYQPTTKTSEGTGASLIKCHDGLAAAVLLVLKKGLEVSSLLPESNFPLKAIDPTFVDLHKLLRFARMDLQLPLLRLLVKWYEQYFGFVTTGSLTFATKSVMEFYYKCENFEHQLYLAIILGYLKEKDRKLLSTVLVKTGHRLGNVLKDYVDLFPHCKPPAGCIPSFAYLVSHLRNVVKGIHRKVFSFRLGGPARASDEGTNLSVSLDDPFAHAHAHSKDGWCLHFNIPTETLSFELLDVENQRFFVNIPCQDIWCVDVTSSEKSFEIRFDLSKLLRRYFGKKNAAYHVEQCASITFRLDFPAESSGPQICLLEEALYRCFGSRARSKGFQCTWNVPDTCPQTADEAGRVEPDTHNPFRTSRVDPGVVVPDRGLTRPEEKDFHRDVALNHGEKLYELTNGGEKHRHVSSQNGLDEQPESLIAEDESEGSSNAALDAAAAFVLSEEMGEPFNFDGPKESISQVSPRNGLLNGVSKISLSDHDGSFNEKDEAGFDASVTCLEGDGLPDNLVDLVETQNATDSITDESDFDLVLPDYARVVQNQGSTAVADDHNGSATVIPTRDTKTVHGRSRKTMTLKQAPVTDVEVQFSERKAREKRPVASVTVDDFVLKREDSPEILTQSAAGERQEKRKSSQRARVAKVFNGPAPANQNEIVQLD